MGTPEEKRKRKGEKVHTTSEYKKITKEIYSETMNAEKKEKEEEYLRNKFYYKKFNEQKKKYHVDEIKKISDSVYDVSDTLANNIYFFKELINERIEENKIHLSRSYVLNQISSALTGISWGVTIGYGFLSIFSFGAFIGPSLASAAQSSLMTYFVENAWKAFRNLEAAQNNLIRVRDSRAFNDIEYLAEVFKNKKYDERFFNIMSSYGIKNADFMEAPSDFSLVWKSGQELFSLGLGYFLNSKTFTKLMNEMADSITKFAIKEGVVSSAQFFHSNLKTFTEISDLFISVKDVLLDNIYPKFVKMMVHLEKELAIKKSLIFMTGGLSVVNSLITIFDTLVQVTSFGLEIWNDIKIRNMIYAARIKINKKKSI
ncbi:hypothetical protein ACM0JF_00175 [Mycoplasma sp. 654]|uniref:hypothetical protein n=1 Tax=Mycoplasma sp. 654 TaxID=3398773 RepID=UPI003A89CE4C